MIGELIQKGHFSQALLSFKQLLLSGARLTCRTFALLLKNSAFLSAPCTVLCLHGMVIKNGYFQSSLNVLRSICRVYMKLGLKREAWQLFDEMPFSASILLNALIRDFGYTGSTGEVWMIFERMRDIGVCPDPTSITKIIFACGEMKCLDKGLVVHDFVRRNSLNIHLLVANSLISMYINLGRLDLARQSFDQMPIKDTVSWNSMVCSYARVNWTEAFRFFASMKATKTVPNRITFLGVMMACGQAGHIEWGRGVHGHLIRTGLLWDLQVGTSVMDMYCKCGRVDCARKFFDKELIERSLVSWNSLIAGYSHNDYHHEAIEIFCQMLVDSNVNPDMITMANLLPSYAGLSNIRMTQSIHSFIIKTGYGICNDVFLGTSMVDAYGKCFDIEAANALFRSMDKPNTATCNAMLAGYCLNNKACQALKLFQDMLSNNDLDSVTLVTLLQLVGGLNFLKQGISIHGFCILSGFDSCLMISNSLIDMYMSCGSTKISQILFDMMPEKTTVTWNTMLGGLVKNSLHSGAWALFHQMRLEGQCKPDPITMVSVIQVSSVHGQIDITYGFVLKSGFDLYTMVLNSLIDTYSKSGVIDKARYLYENMGTLRDQSSWNVMISGCGMHGRGEEACSLFSRMEEEGHEPNSITFLSLLSACSHSGLISKGCKYFDLMVTKYGYRPGLEHYTCIIDMYGRGGRLEDAYQLIERMPEEMVCDGVWGALLSACKTSANLERGELVGKRLLRSASKNCGYYTTLSHIYASRGRWEDAMKVREVFEQGWLGKKTARSTLV